MRLRTLIIRLSLIWLMSLFIPLICSAGSSQKRPIKENPTFHQKIERFLLPLTPDEMEYILDNLPYASELLNQYGINTLRITSLGDGGFSADDSTAIKGTFQLVKKDGRFREYEGNGTLAINIVGEINADVVATILYREHDVSRITNDLEMWVLVNNSFLDFLCRVFRPLLKGILKSNLEFFIGVTQQFAERYRAEKNMLTKNLK